MTYELAQKIIEKSLLRPVQLTTNVDTIKFNRDVAELYANHKWNEACGEQMKIAVIHFGITPPNKPLPKPEFKP